MVADAGPLIALAKLDRLDLMEALFNRVLVPEAVAEECIRDARRLDARRIRGALERGGRFERIPSVVSPGLGSLSRLLDPGEAQVLAMAREQGVLALIDEQKGRREARRMGIEIVGTGALLVAAKRRGMVTEVAPLLEQMVQDGYRLSTRLCQALLEQCGER